MQRKEKITAINRLFFMITPGRNFSKFFHPLNNVGGTRVFLASECLILLYLKPSILPYSLVSLSTISACSWVMNRTFLPWA